MNNEHAGKVTLLIDSNRCYLWTARGAVQFRLVYRHTAFWTQESGWVEKQVGELSRKKDVCYR